MVELHFETLHELVKKARQNLNHNIWDYVVGGSETETAVRRNRLALDALAFRPRVLRDVSVVDARAEFLGRPLRLPVMLAPVGSLELIGLDGCDGGAAAAAAGEFGVVHMLSSVAKPGLEGTAAAAPGAARIFQLYVHGDADWVDAMVERTIAAGNMAFCLTVDTAHYSRRERDLAKRHFRRRNVPGREYLMALNWKDIERIRRKCTIPLIIKGIATAEDTKIAIEHGVDVIYISNHGGRQLDHGRGTMDMLPEIRDVSRGRAKIIIDGGFNRGSDIVKAVAAGADLVGMGRMQCFALAAEGQRGVVRMLEILENEVQTCFGLLGITRWSELDSSYICKDVPVPPSKSFGAFPLLNLGDETFY
jgi:isopentenyl diphosphate isomerase/L-lactate dehydrogenase-like FMN-dependent dehydrogenase